MSDPRLAKALRPWQRRFWLQRGIRWTLGGLVTGLAAAAVVLLAARLLPWADAVWWALGVAAAGPLTGLAYALATPPSMDRAARRVDGVLGLADREATAWELRDAEGTFASLQRQNALTSLRGRSMSTVRLWPGRRRFATVLAVSAAVALLALLPNPMDRVLAERHELQEQLAEAKEEVRNTREEMAESGPRLSAEEREALEEALKKLEERLDQARDKPEALAALSEAERELQQLRDPGQAQALQATASALGTLPAGSSLAEALQSGDSEALAEAMDALAEQMASLSPEERQELMTALQQAANAAAGVSGQGQALAEALRNAAREIGAGNAEAGQAALATLEDLLAALQDGAAADQVVASVMNDLSDARASISGIAVASGGPSQGTQGSSDGGGDGSGEGEGSGDGTGSGDGAGSGDGSGSGSGSGDGSGSGTGVGDGGGQGGTGAGNTPGAQQGEGTGRLETGGETVFIPSQGDGGLPGTSAGPGQGTVPGELRPYREVIGQYAAQAREHMERSPVPEGYKDLVRRYFAELEQ